MNAITDRLTGLTGVITTLTFLFAVFFTYGFFGPLGWKFIEAMSLEDYVVTGITFVPFLVPVLMGVWIILAMFMLVFGSLYLVFLVPTIAIALILLSRKLWHLIVWLVALLWATSFTGDYGWLQFGVLVILLVSLVLRLASPGRIRQAVSFLPTQTAKRLSPLGTSAAYGVVQRYGKLVTPTVSGALEAIFLSVPRSLQFLGKHNKKLWMAFGIVLAVLYLAGAVGSIVLALSDPQNSPLSNVAFASGSNIFEIPVGHGVSVSLWVAIADYFAGGRLQPYDNSFLMLLYSFNVVFFISLLSFVILAVASKPVREMGFVRFLFYALTFTGTAATSFTLGNLWVMRQMEPLLDLREGDFEEVAIEEEFDDPVRSPDDPILCETCTTIRMLSSGPVVYDHAANELRVHNVRNNEVLHRKRLNKPAPDWVGQNESFWDQLNGLGTRFVRGDMSAYSIVPLDLSSASTTQEFVEEMSVLREAADEDWRSSKMLIVIADVEPDVFLPLRVEEQSAENDPDQQASDLDDEILKTFEGLLALEVEAVADPDTVIDEQAEDQNESVQVAYAKLSSESNLKRYLFLLPIDRNTPFVPKTVVCNSGDVVSLMKSGFGFTVNYGCEPFWEYMGPALRFHYFDEALCREATQECERAIMDTLLEVSEGDLSAVWIALPEDGVELETQPQQVPDRRGPFWAGIDTADLLATEDGGVQAPYLRTRSRGQRDCENFERVRYIYSYPDISSEDFIEVRSYRLNINYLEVTLEPDPSADGSSQREERLCQFALRYY